MRTNGEKKVFTVILVALELFLAVTDLGYFSIGMIALTILHIPVFLAVIIIGLPQGVLLAAIFGASSMITAYLHPRGRLDYLFQNPMIAVLPRLLVPFAVWLVYKAICRLAGDHTLSADLICTGFASMSGVIANAAFVMIALVMRAPEAIGVTDSFSASTLIITNIVAANIVYEILIAVIVTCLVVLLLRKCGLRSGSDSEADLSNGAEYTRPVQITFQKWLFLFMVLTFIWVLTFMYHLISNLDRQNAEALIRSEADWIVDEIQKDNLGFSEKDLELGELGGILIISDDMVISSHRKALRGRIFSDICPGYEKIRKDAVTDMSIDGIRGIGVIEEESGYLALLFIPEREMYEGRDYSLASLLIGLAAIFLMLFVLISILLNHNVVKRINAVNGSLGQIRSGNLDEKVTVGGNIEFEELSLGINTTVDALKKTMLEIEKRNRQEMEFARDVQNSVLPSGGLSGDGFSITGSMQAAREIGGDFYDYFLIGGDRLGFVIGDVSGKGVPAALFMMTSKTLIKDYVLSGKSPAEALRLANLELCENNDAGMFVTVWLGILDLKTRRLEFANAAHNPPLLKKNGEPFRYMDYKTYSRSFVLGGFPQTKFSNAEITFEQGDMLFLYTDGVTEAADPDMNLYGEERLLNCMESCFELPPETLLQTVRRDLDTFAAGAEQSDDITMVVLK